MSVCPSIHKKQLGSHWMDFHEVWYEYFSKIRRKNLSLNKSDMNNGHCLKPDMNTGYFIWRPISPWILLRTRVSGSIVQKNKTYILHLITFLQKSCSLWECGKIWYNQTDDTVIRLMHFASWISKATDIDSEFVTLIAFLWHQKLCERAPLLRLYKHCTSCPLSSTILLITTTGIPTKKLHGLHKGSVPSEMNSTLWCNTFIHNTLLSHLL